MIIRNNQTKGAIHRFIFLHLALFSLSLMSFRGKDNVQADSPEIYQYGKASYYAGQFIGRKTANGEIFTSREFTCAHKSLPFGTKLKVTNLATNESIIVRVNDRGPYVESRIVDLSLTGAKELGLLQCGVANVSIEIVNKEFSNLGNTRTMERIMVDDKFAYIDSRDEKMFDKVYTYLAQSLQLEEYASIKPKKEDTRIYEDTIKGTSKQEESLFIE